MVKHQIFTHAQIPSKLAHLCCHRGWQHLFSQHSMAACSHPSHATWKDESSGAQSRQHATWAQSLFHCRQNPCPAPAFLLLHCTWQLWWCPGLGHLGKCSPFFLLFTGLKMLCQEYHNPHPIETKTEPEESDVTCSSLKCNAAAEKNPHFLLWVKRKWNFLTHNPRF